MTKPSTFSPEVSQRNTFTPSDLDRVLSWLLFFFILITPGFSQETTQDQSNASPITKGQALLKTAREVAAYPIREDYPHARVSITGVVIFTDTNTIFVQDDSGATFIHDLPKNQTYYPGQALEIHGKTHRGLFISGVQPQEIKKIPGGKLPAPKEVNVHDLSTGIFHYQLVRFEGVVRNVENTSENACRIRVSGAGGIIEVLIDEKPENLEALVDARIQIDGLAAGYINDRHQLITPYIRIKNQQAITIIRSPVFPPFQLPETHVSELTSTRPHRVKISGVALAPPLDGNLYLSQDQFSILIQFSSPPMEEIDSGDHLEVVGFVDRGPFSTQLADCIWRKSSIHAIRNPPEPIVLNSLNKLSDLKDSQLYKLPLKVLQRMDLGHRTHLVAEMGHTPVQLIIPEILPHEIGPQSMISATGIVRITNVLQERYRTHPASFELLARGAKDIVLIQMPPWLTTEKLTKALMMVLLLTLLIFVWGVLQKIQLNKQLRLIQTKMQEEAVTDERRRIAREFHDTLEQELAGVSIRLDAVLAKVNESPVSNILDQIQKLLRRLQIETRNFIWDLRETTQTQHPFIQSLEPLIQHLQSTVSIPIYLQTDSQLQEWTPSPLTQHHLLSITREAIHNAIKHASAQSILVGLKRSEQGYPTLSISDDGVGFDQPKISPGHFGLQGIQERCRKIKAHLVLDSKPSEGTHLTIQFT